ncbi:MAG: lipid-A-disaccharide synthase [Candidatus Omnitrophica bacterium]|jgi:lipid-A-disaccharide synthase|nr:lipid-A-disaccharide synthase [Candidatus Omnitrophota bacterium]MDD5079504.1 lipid-A-disaccharide synthase [Candidatus Omnitrophota bacterium]
MEKPKKILIVCGEASGDLHAAHLVSEIKKIYPSVRFAGLGGNKLKAAGVELYYDLTKLAVIGFWEVLKNLKTFKKIFRRVLEEAQKDKPDLAILVDYPGFNLRLAEKLRELGIPVAYYISPQVWAWGKNRLRSIKKNIARMIVLFPFEEKIYRQNDIPVSFVGHPLLDVVKTQEPKEAFLAKHGLSRDKLTISLLPGSREKEVRTLLPVMLKSAQEINEYFYGRAQFLILRSPTVKKEAFDQALAGFNLPIKMISDATYDGIAASDFSLVCSGTATLETGILGTPMVILYTVNLLTWAFIRLMIKIPYIGLVNVVKEKKVCEEFIQFQCNPKAICDYLIPVLQDKDRLSQLKLELLDIKQKLGAYGASQKAARVIADMLKGS